MNADLLAAIKVRCEATTPGPWEWLTDGGYRLATTHSGRIHVMRFFRKGLHDAQPGFRDDLAVVKADDLDLYEHADAQFIAHARADIPALLAYIEHLKRRYTMPCPYCDFGSGQRGMDRCTHCDGTGRMDAHVFVTQQRDAARAEVEGLRAELMNAEADKAELAQALGGCKNLLECMRDDSAINAFFQWKAAFEIWQAIAALARVKGAV